MSELPDDFLKLCAAARHPDRFEATVKAIREAEHDDAKFQIGMAVE